MSDQTKKPNSYTSEFKESAVESDQPIAQTVRDLGWNPNTLPGLISIQNRKLPSKERMNLFMMKLNGRRKTHMGSDPFIFQQIKKDKHAKYFSIELTSLMFSPYLPGQQRRTGATPAQVLGSQTFG